MQSVLLVLGMFKSCDKPHESAKPLLPADGQHADSYYLIFMLYRLDL